MLMSCMCPCLQCYPLSNMLLRPVYTQGWFDRSSNLLRQIRKQLYNISAGSKLFKWLQRGWILCFEIWSADFKMEFERLCWGEYIEVDSSFLRGWPWFGIYITTSGSLNLISVLSAWISIVAYRQIHRNGMHVSENLFPYNALW